MSVSNMTPWERFLKLIHWEWIVDFKECGHSAKSMYSPYPPAEFVFCKRCNRLRNKYTVR